MITTRDPIRLHSLRPSVAWLALAICLLMIVGCGSDRDDRPQPAVVSPTEAATATEDRPVLADFADRGNRRHLADLPFDVSWDLQLPAPVHRSWMQDQIHGLLFVQVSSGEIHGIDAYSGETKFVTRPLPKLIKLPPYVASIQVRRDNGEIAQDDRLYVISGDELFVFDCVYGQLIWSHHIGQNGPNGFEPASGPFPMSTEGSLRIFVGDWQGRIRVITYDLDKSWSYIIWQWNLQAVPTAQPTGRENLCYVGDRGGIMSCFSLDRERRWVFDARAPIMSSPLVRDHTVYFGANDNILHALNRLTGVEMGKLFLDAPITRKPYAFDSDLEHVFAWTEDKDPRLTGLHCFYTKFDTIPYQDVEKHRLEVERMAKEWFLPGVQRLVASSPGHLYVTAPGSTEVLDVDRTTGEINWRWQLEEERYGEDAITHMVEYTDRTDRIRSIITASANGRMVAYRLFGHQR